MSAFMPRLYASIRHTLAAIDRFAIFAISIRIHAAAIITLPIRHAADADVFDAAMPFRHAMLFFFFFFHFFFAFFHFFFFC